MPRSQKLQHAIDQRRTTLTLPPRPKNGEKAPHSWWIGLSREELRAKAEEEKARMRPHQGIVGDKGVLYGG
jgi:hypothetical protein